MRRKYIHGVFLLLGAGLFWSLNGGLIKLVFDQGAGPSGVTIAFYRSLFAGLFLMPFARGRFHSLCRNRTVNPKEERESSVASAHVTPEIHFSLLRLRPAVVCCVVFFTVMTICFVIATTKTEAANAIILQYTSTFWVFGLSPLVLGEKPRFQELWILALAMGGIAVIFVGQASTDAVGLMIALIAGLFFGLLTLMIRRLRDVDSAAMTVINLLGSSLLLLPAVAIFGHFDLSGRSLLLLLFMGAIQFGLPYYLFTLGLKSVPAYLAALLTMVEPVLVPVWAYWIVGEIPSHTTLVGGGVILLALVLLLRASRSTGRSRLGREQDTTSE